MKDVLAEQATHYVRDWVTLALVGMGVSMAPHQYFGGLFLALAAAMVMARHRKDPRKVWLTVSTAFLIATLVSIGWTERWLLPVQLCMAASGFASKPIVNFLSKFMDRVEDRTGDIADKAIDKFLPDKKDAE